MELTKNDVCWEFESRNYNLHHSWIVNSWSLLVCFCSPLSYTSWSKTIRLKPYTHFSLLFSSFFCILLRCALWIVCLWELTLVCLRLSFFAFCWIWNLHDNQEIIIAIVFEHSTWWSCLSSSCLFWLCIYLVCLNNAQHAFVLFYYAKKLVRGLFDLGVGLLC
jgi:hypothetical protein